MDALSPVSYRDAMYRKSQFFPFDMSFVDGNRISGLATLCSKKYKNTVRDGFRDTSTISCIRATSLQPTKLYVALIKTFFQETIRPRIFLRRAGTSEKRYTIKKMFESYAKLDINSVSHKEGTFKGTKTELCLLIINVMEESIFFGNSDLHQLVASLRGTIECLRLQSENLLQVFGL